MDTTEETDEVVIHFVTHPSEHNGTGSPMMLKAFQSMRYRKCSPIWTADAKIENVVKDLGDDEAIFVIDREHFDKPAFNFLLENACRIISPYVVKFCDEDVAQQPFASIPKREHPILSQCMRKLVISCTNLSTTVKKEVERKIRLMCGFYESGLNGSTTFLVSDCVLTKKYQAAVQLKIPVMRLEWVEACWDKHQYDFQRADSPELVAKYTLPIFHGLTISVSQFDYDQRNKYAEIIKSNGGTYSASLRFDVPNTILLLQEKEGEKYTYAKKKKIPRLTIDWLHDSVKAKYALSLDAYSIDVDEVDTSAAPTPAKPFRKPFPTQKAMPPQQPATLDTVNKDLVQTLLDLRLSVQDVDCLEGCAIFATGFDEPTMKAIKQVVRHCGAFFHSNFSGSVTHALVGPSFSKATDTNNLLDQLEQVVTIEWLVASMKALECVPYLPYKYSPTSTFKVDLCTAEGTAQAQKLLARITEKREAEEARRREEEKTKKAAAARAHPKNVDDSDSEEDAAIVMKWPTDDKVYQKQPLKENKQSQPLSDKGANISSCSSRGHSKKRLEDSDEENFASPRSSKKRTGDTISNYTEDEEGDDFDGEEERRMFHEADSSTQTGSRSYNAETSQRSDLVSSRMSNSPGATAIIDNSPDSNDMMDDMITSGYTSPPGPPKLVFMLSGFDPNDKEALTQQSADKLRIRIADSPTIDPSATHLILHEPFGTEKLISAIAAGMWILTPKYITDSLEAGRCLPEEPYEWGNQVMDKSKMSNRHRLVQAAMNWRKHFGETGKRAFHEWTVVVMNKTEKSTSMRNILTAGGATVHLIEDLEKDKRGFESLRQRINYAVLEMKDFSMPPLNKAWYRTAAIKYFIDETKLAYANAITRYLFAGAPDGGLESLGLKVFITQEVVNQTIGSLLK